MQKLTPFTDEEDLFLLDNCFSMKPSRLALRLNRPYSLLIIRLEELRLMDRYKVRKILNGKYFTDDEIDYNLLSNGITEIELIKLRGISRVGVSERIIVCW